MQSTERKSWEKKGELKAICRELSLKTMKFYDYDFPLGCPSSPQNKAFHVGFKRRENYSLREKKNGRGIC